MKKSQKNRAQKPSLTSRLWSGIRYMPALTIVAGSSALNAKFGFMQATGYDTATQYAVAAVFLGLDWLKPFLPSYISKQETIGKRWIGRLGFTSLIALSFLAAFGFSATMRSQNTGAKANVMEEWKTAKANKASYERKLEALGKTMTRSQINLERSKIKATKGRAGKSVMTYLDCMANPHSKSYGYYSKKYCPVLERLSSEERKREKQIVLENRLEKVETFLAKGKPQEADPQAKSLSELTGFGQHAITLILILLPAIVLEMASAFAFEFTSGSNGKTRKTVKTETTTVKPKDLMELLNLRKDKNGNVFIVQKNVAQDLNWSPPKVSREVTKLYSEGVIAQKISKTIDGQRGTMLTLA